MGNSGNRFFAEGRRNRVENQIRFNARHKNEVKANGFAYLLCESNAISNTRCRCVSCVKFGPRPELVEGSKDLPRANERCARVRRGVPGTLEAESEMIRPLLLYLNRNSG